MLHEIDFHRKGTKRKSWCKQCQKLIHKAHYEANKAHRIERAQVRNMTVKAELVSLIACIKENPCADCNQRFDVVCMDFDHVHGQKKFDISSYMGGNRLSKRILLEELNKCELVCSNCHRKRTAARLRTLAHPE